MTDDTDTRTRRRMLELAGGVTATALAGCSGFLSKSKPTGSKTEAKPTVIENIAFLSQKFIVRLKDGTNADAIDFRDSSGELLRTASVGRKSTIDFPLFDTSGTPYPPGEYTLVAVETSGDEPERINKHSIKLTSAFSVIHVQPVYEDPQSDFSSSKSPPFATKVRVTLMNTGKLPVGIKYIGVPEGVPSPTEPPTASGSVGFRPVDEFDSPPYYIPANRAMKFQSVGTPLWYYESSVKDSGSSAVGVPKQGATWKQIQRNHCNGETHTATLVVVPVQGQTHRQPVTFKYSGQATQRDSMDVDYGCTNVSVVSIETETSNTTNH